MQKSWVFTSQQIYMPNRPHSTDENQHSGKSDKYLTWWRCQSLGHSIVMVLVADTWFNAKIMGFDESTNLPASQIDRTAPKATGTAAKAANICHDIAAEILDTDSQWLLPPPPVSGNVATKKIRRSENFRFSRASAENLPVSIKYEMKTTGWMAADALQRLIQYHIGLSYSVTRVENFAVIKHQNNEFLTSSGEHFASWGRTFPQIVMRWLMVLFYVITAGESCYCYHVPL